VRAEAWASGKPTFPILGKEVGEGRSADMFSFCSACVHPVTCWSMHGVVDTFPFAHIFVSFEESLFFPVQLADVRAKLVIRRLYVFHWN
jgi:hypothetical protein